MRPVLATCAIALVGVAAARPEWAARSLHLLVATVVVALLTDVVVERIARVEDAPPRPFVPPDPPTSPSVETTDVAELVRLVEQSHGTIPHPIVQRLRAAARGRLTDHHRLRPGCDDGGPAPATAPGDALVGDRVRALLRTDDEVVMPIRSLPLLLDEVEAL